MQLCGIGEITATALWSTIGNGATFVCGRQFGLAGPGAWAIQLRRQARLGRITKAGDPYLRSLLVLGARAVLLAAAKTKSDPISRWAVSLEQRRGYWKAIVAIAAKNARLCWAVPAKARIQAAGMSA